ncbi:MAG: aspartyl/asparaginyl beta-hydroxylase domain-containing protein [Acidobacteria bacterium]|nr:aspartyl/asparaginyl beta-hydroxylase domain-containing protein [Acidobacteriota bacterium]
MFFQLLSFGSVLTFCVLYSLKVNNLFDWPDRIISLPLFILYPSLAAAIGLFWEAVAGNLFRLGLLSLPTTHRRILFPLLFLCVIVAILSHLFLMLRPFDNSTYARMLIPASVVLTLGTATLVSLRMLKRVLDAVGKKRRRNSELGLRLKDFRDRFDGASLQRIEDFVSLETGRAAFNPPALIRGAVFPGLSSKAWYDISEFAWTAALEARYEMIKAEVTAMAQSRAGLEQYSYPGLGDNNWQSFMFFKEGKRFVENCARCPETTKLLETIPGGLRREAMISLLGSGARIPAHRDSGNQLLTCHFGLVIPRGCGIRVGGESRLWQEGKCLIFDTSYEHEAWNDSEETRIVLLVDFWHPELTEVERQFLEQVEGLGYW